MLVTMNGIVFLAGMVGLVTALSYSPDVRRCLNHPNKTVSLDSGNCTICKCERLPMACYTIHCPKLVCPSGTYQTWLPGKCCKFCRKCVDKHSACAAEAAHYCEHLVPYFKKIWQDLCPVTCKMCGCMYKEKIYPAGVSFQPDNEPCKSCYCEHAGQLPRCTIKQCFIPPICPGGMAPVSDPKECCPVCQKACVDNYPSCPEMAARGDCEHEDPIIREDVQARCRLTCTQCEKACVDNYPSCPEEAAHGDCEHEDPIIKEDVQARCPLSCTRCALPTYPKPLTCPKPPMGYIIEPGMCVEACSNDDGCAPHDKCCFNGCGHECMPAMVYE